VTDKIAFLQFGAAGDIMFATPTLRYLKSRHPNAEIEWFVRDVFCNLVETNPHISSVRTYELKNHHCNKQMDEGVMWNQMKEDAKNGDYSIIASPQMWPDHNFYRSELHIVDMMMENVFGLGTNFPYNEKWLEINVPLVDDKNVSKYFTGKLARNGHGWHQVVTINHLSNAASPVWTQEQYKQLALELLDHDLVPMFTGNSLEPMPEVEGALDARGTTFREWTACIQRSAFWFGLDTGAKGLACCTDTPMLVLQSQDFQLHKTGVANHGLCKTPKPIFEISHPITVDAAIDIITHNVKT